MIALLLLTATQSPNVEDLLECMRLPTTGHFLVETVEEGRPPAEDELARSLRFAREHQGDWHARLLAEDPAWVRARPHLFAPDWVPLLLVRSQVEPGTRRTTEFVEWRGESFDWAMDVPVQPSAQSEATVTGTQHRLRIGGELFSWTTTPVGPSRTTRLRAVKSPSLFQNACFDFAERCEEVRGIVETAQSHGGIEATGGELVLHADLRSLEALRPFSVDSQRLDPILPAALHEMPGTVTGRFARTTEGSRLELQWTCFGGAVVCSDFLRWEACGELPSEWRRELRVPEAERPFLVRRSAARLVPGSRPLRWEPLPGQEVLDLRFGTRLYRIGPDGTVPDDGALAEEAERQYLLEHQEAFDDYRFQSTGRAPGPAGLELPWDTIDLGRQPLKSTHPVRFELTNRGPAPIELGQASGDCTCLEISSLPPRLAPGETTYVTARQRVLGVGRTTTSLRVPVGADDELELSIVATGIQAPLVIPDPLHVGRVTAGSAIAFELRVEGAGCLATGAPPVLAAEGFAVEQRWSSPDKDGVSWQGSIVLTPEAPGPLGAREATVTVLLAGCPASSGGALLSYESVPADAPEDWPDCRVVLSPDPARPLHLRFPGTSITSTGMPNPLFACERRASAGGDELVLAAAPSGGSNAPIRAATVTLSTSRGTLRVKAIVPPTRGPGLVVFPLGDD